MTAGLRVQSETRSRWSRENLQPKRPRSTRYQEFIRHSPVLRLACCTWRDMLHGMQFPPKRANFWPGITSG
jgi:hypothetical protein